MAEPTLTEVFGANASQDANSFTISKADLAEVGLIANDNNTAESLLAATIEKVQKALNEINRDANLDQSIYIENNLPNYVTRENENYRQKSKTIYFEKLDDDSEFNPNDY